MRISTGSQLGPYTVVSAIGAGGMGEVYRAHDAKLGRDVAIKVLPQVFVNDAERLARFQREARILASLNHPNIATVFQLERDGANSFLVMELVDGQTLAERLRSGPLNRQDALPIALQIAEALEAAHEKGVIHRDLKPANVKVTPEARVKVLDFGLAKAFAYDDAGSSHSPTLTSSNTEEGRVLGTPAYMSPEQTRGKPVDKRADIWAFGCLLFELLTARRAFRGDTSSDTIAAVLEKEPDWEALPASVPQRIRDLLRRCLTKDPQRRLRDLGDARIEIEEALASLSGTGSQISLHRDGPRPALNSATRSWAWIPWSLSALLATAFVIWVLTHRFPPALPNPLAEAQFTRLTGFKGNETNPAISPDGKFVAFLSDRTGNSDIWLIQANGGSLANITQGRIGDARAPLRALGFSEDGVTVWSAGTEGQPFPGMEGRRLMLWPLIGGPPHNFLDEGVAEAAWSPDGTRVVYHKWKAGDPMYVADHNGGNARLIFQTAPGAHNHFQVWSRDGRWIYFVSGRPATRELDLWRVSPGGGEPEQLSHLNTDIAFPAPIDDRTILFVAHSAEGAGPWLWAFDLSSRTARRVSFGLEEYTAVAASASGKRLAASIVNTQVNLWSVPITDRTIEEKQVEPFQLPTPRAQAPRFGARTLFYLSSRSGVDGLWSYRDGQALEIWSGAEGGLQSPPAVSNDGSAVAFALKRDGKYQLHVLGADGTQLRPLSKDVDARGTASWSPDGQWIVVAGADAKGEGLFKLPVHGGAPVRLATGPSLDPVWSPSGDLIVYSGEQVFTVAPLLAIRPDGTPVKLPVPHLKRSGERARFLPDGSGLVYMLGATLAGQDFWLLDLKSLHSRRLTHLSDSAVMRTFDITPDGRRIVFDRLVEDSDIVLIDLKSNGS